MDTLSLHLHNKSQQPNVLFYNNALETYNQCVSLIYFRKIMRTIIKYGQKSLSALHAYKYSNKINFFFQTRRQGKSIKNVQLTVS